MQEGKFNILVDAAWGSSGKGAAAARLADLYSVENLSASNYPNAGHTVVMKRDGEFGTAELAVFTFKTLPSGAAMAWMKDWYKPTLFIGPNSGIWYDQWTKELRAVGLPQALCMIHPRAVMMHERHVLQESPEGSQSTEHISSTMSGSGAAFAEKAMRKELVQTAGKLGIGNSHFQEVVSNRLFHKRTFLHEVSQGYALSVNHGTHYPHCTFRDCTPQQAAADFQVLPSQIGDVYLNIRSRPIRVGCNFRDGKQTGYSGDFYPDQEELTWERIGREAGMPKSEIETLAEKERTTVTRKIRRVATQSYKLLAEAASRCGATKLIFNFPQYIDWSAHGVRGGREEYLALHPKVRAELDRVEEATNLKIVMIGTGRQHEEFIWLD